MIALAKTRSKLGGSKPKELHACRNRNEISKTNLKFCLDI